MIEISFTYINDETLKKKYEQLLEKYKRLKKKNKNDNIIDTGNDITLDILSYKNFSRLYWPLKKKEKKALFLANDVFRDWLDDECINRYLGLLGHLGMENVNIFNTHMFKEYFVNIDHETESFLRFLRRKNIEVENKKTFIPINTGNLHWVYILVDMTDNKKSMYYVDSFAREPQPEYCYYMAQLGNSLNIKIKDENPWNMAYMSRVQQGRYIVNNVVVNDGKNCGVFLCQNIKFNILGWRISLLHSGNMELFRKAMVSEILDNQIYTNFEESSINDSVSITFTE